MRFVPHRSHGDLVRTPVAILDPLHSEPIHREVLAMAGLRIKRQDLLVQPPTPYLQVVPGGRPEAEIPANRPLMSLPLATIRFVRAPKLHGSVKLSRQPLRRRWIDLLMALRKPAVQLHELQLDGKPQPAFVGHARQQGQFIGGQRPVVVKFSLDPGLRHVQVRCKLGDADYRTKTADQMS
jgi:hypothetical protein